MARSLVSPRCYVLAPSAVVLVAGTGPTGNLPICQAESYALFVNCSAITGTLDIALQTSADNGATWFTFNKMTQITAIGQAVIRWQPTLGFGEAASQSTVAVTGSAVNINCPFNPAYFRLYYTVATTSATFSVQLIAVSKNDAIA